MTNIKLDYQAMSNIKSENLIAMLNAVIDSELDKDISQVNTSLVEECVDAVLQIEQDEDSSFKVLIPLLKSDDFLRKIVPKEKVAPWKRLNAFARVAVVAAVVATGTFSVNAAVGAITGVNVIEKVANSISDFFNDKDDGKLNTVVIVPSKKKPTTTKPHKTTTQAITTTESIEATTKEETTEASTQEATTEQTIENLEVTSQTTTKPQTTSTTTAKRAENASFTGVKARFDNFKTAYIYGEELSYDGLTIYALYSNGKQEAVPLSDCFFTKNIDMNVTADYVLNVIYKDCSVKINITVRPDEATRFSEICSNDTFDYLNTKNGAYITKYKGNDTSLNLNSVDGSPVYAITAGVFEDVNISSIKSNTLEVIYSKAFKNCKSLAVCDTPNVISIGDSAFEGCEKLESPSFSEKLSGLGERAYANSGIKKIDVPKAITSVPSGLCEDCAALETVRLLGSPTSVGDGAFSKCSSLSSVIGTKNIERVFDFAFYEDENVSFDYQLNNLKSVGKYAFSKCKMLDVGTLPNIEKIDDGSFEYCILLKSVTIPKSIKTIPFACFMGTRLEAIELHSEIERIESYAFMSTQIKTVKIPAKAKYVGTRAFFTTRLRDVYVYNADVEIDDDAFYAGSRTTIYGFEGSSAEKYAIENDINYSAIEL